MKSLKENNKGFSLVELIVVVLIMAIIAVALAPQVMKWVNNSRESADANNYDSLYANVQLALTDKTAYEKVIADTGKTVVLVISTDADVTSNTGTADTATVTAVTDALTKLDSGWTKIRKKVSGSTTYSITINCGNPPSITKNAPTLSSSDLQ